MKQQRRKIFIDVRLQGRLILLMVALEIVILAAAMLYLNHRFAGMIEHDLYAIHRISQADMLSNFTIEIVRVIFVMLILNAILMLFVHSIWSGQINSVVQVFCENLEQIRKLKFSGSAPINQHEHELLALLRIWHSKERDRIAALKQEIEQVTIQDHYQGSELQTLRDSIKRCMRLLES